MMDYSFGMQSCKSASPLSEERLRSGGPGPGPALMISASGSNPLRCCGGGALILPAIRLMNDPGREALADPALIMPREPHLGGARAGDALGGGGAFRRLRDGRLAGTQGPSRRRSPTGGFLFPRRRRLTAGGDCCVPRGFLRDMTPGFLVPPFRGGDDALDTIPGRNLEERANIESSIAGASQR
ncbi:hypothetical protein DPEC_G00278760 [Dallia pectoralis]|uniref:Uncharacterized protein n=1 Tax=Dallia pectoralis TaxID=75939 RepID=A0ACC2FM76_DALPE|nr:hypothetical protein DPEC_G00278760 [Dallia pectoralis]